MQLPVLFENHDLIAIDKPSGLLSHASVDESRADALRTLVAQLQIENVWLIHRLDRETSGVLLFAKTTEAQAEMTTLFRERRIHKTYLGIAKGAAPKPPEWRIENYLAEEKIAASKAPRSVGVRSGGQKAITDFKILKSQGNTHLIECHPLTGRRHQIRTHLMDSKYPLVGDKLYGGLQGSRVLLHAWKLEWENKDGEKIEIEAPVPTDFPLQP